MTPLTVFLGPNGSGKSTVFDVFAFLSECFSVGMPTAWERRGRFKDLRTRGELGPIEIEMQYRERPDDSPITYHLSIDESSRGPFVAREWLDWRGLRILDFQEGELSVVTDEQGELTEERLSSPVILAVNALGQLERYPRVAALRRFITGWYLSDLSAESPLGSVAAGPQERLSPTGDNLANVIQYLQEQHPNRLTEVLRALAKRVPRLESVTVDVVPDGRLLLQIKDAPFEQPILARFASEGTLKLLAYLTLLYDPDSPPLIGIEEPENFLHPRLLPDLAEECRQVTSRTQLLVSSHSPFFVNALRADEVWALYRDERGFTQARRAADMRGIPEFLSEGALLGDLWLEGHFEAGDPLVRSGGSKVASPR